MGRHGGGHKARGLCGQPTHRCYLVIASSTPINPPEKHAQQQLPTVVPNVGTFLKGERQATATAKPAGTPPPRCWGRGRPRRDDGWRQTPIGQAAARLRGAPAARRRRDRRRVSHWSERSHGARAGYVPARRLPDRTRAVHRRAARAAAGCLHGPAGGGARGARGADARLVARRGIL